MPAHMDTKFILRVQVDISRVSTARKLISYPQADM